MYCYIGTSLGHSHNLTQQQRYTTGGRNCRDGPSPHCATGRASRSSLLHFLKWNTTQVLIS